MPFTVTAHFKMADLGAGSGHPSIGIMLLDATATAIRTFEMDQTAGNLLASLRRYTNRTSFATSVDTTIAAVNAITSSPDLYMRLLVTSSSSATFSYSLNGYQWRAVASLAAIDPTITVTYVGLEVSDPVSACTVEAVVDWIRFV